MSHLSCPTCGFTLFDRTPLLTSISAKECPRCARRGKAVQLEPRVRPHPAAVAKEARG